MKYKSTLAWLLSTVIFSSLNASAVELFKTESFLSSSVSNRSLTEVNQLRAKNASIQDAYIYDVNPGALSENLNVLTLKINPNLYYDVNKISSSVSSLGSTIWKGRIKSDNTNHLISEAPLLDDNVILVVRGNKVTGTIRANGRLFKIQPLASGQHLVMEINENNIKPDHPAGSIEELETEMSNELIEQASQNYLSQSNIADPVIRVLVVYSNGVRSEVNDIPGLIDLAIAETNQGYANSGVNASVQLAHLQAVNYNEVSISTDLNRLKSTSDGYMDNVHNLRNQYSADVVMLIVPDNGSACGKAAAIGARASSAFAVTAQDCATGYYSFGHEIGHLQSARHNPERDGSNSPYRFGHGYQDPQRQWRTVMAYNCSGGCRRINWWSNPNKTRNGRAMGTSSRSDNVRVLNLTAATVAGFRSGTPTPSNILKNGVPKNNLKASKGYDLDYVMDIPSGAKNIKFSISSGTGDADLYVRYGSKPTTSTYDCRPYKNGNSESCLGTYSGGKYYIKVRAYRSFSGVTLVGRYTN
ncbi:M12 family metallo-peptidase [Aliikangiella sp. IMCC44359]|uniref:M12 family metallo-peptidase n=1 Tax=Aliikangiella sp. IMCC44359 TaxID=3459125 RepID=UPI00403AEE03